MRAKLFVADVALKFDKNNGHLEYNYCDYTYKIPNIFLSVASLATFELKRNESPHPHTHTHGILEKIK